MTFRSRGDDRWIASRPREMGFPAERELLDTFNAM
jgi:hypothetical protein